MNNKIGVVICNYNKKEFVIECIRTVLESKLGDESIDVYVVDNASTDGSADEIAKVYGSKVVLIVNTENLGGSGGFNTGLRAAMKSDKQYDYLMCVDNDIEMDENNIHRLLEFLKNNSDVGMVGSKILRMQHPERLQELGAMIDFDKCTIVPNFKDYLDDESIPKVQYCDYVPACSLMVRREVVEKVGAIPEDNFIYWDDMEWGYRVNLAGYKVAAISDAFVKHYMGTNSGTTYFSTYYFWRNRLNFFIKFTPKEKYENMISVLLENLFKTLYGCYYKGKNNQISVMMHAFDDAVHGKRGKASEGVILPKDEVKDRISELLEKSKSVLIDFNGDYKLLQDLIIKAKKTYRYKESDSFFEKITIACTDMEEMGRQHPECNLLKREDSLPVADEEGTLVLKMCEHVGKIDDYSLKVTYVDGYSNLLADETDITHFRNMNYIQNLFIDSQKVLMRGLTHA